MAKYVITSMPIYTMQNLWISEGVCDKIDAIVCKFVWGSNHSPWVIWETITLTRNHVGLGIHEAQDINISLLGKHIWDMMQEK